MELKGDGYWLYSMSVKMTNKGEERNVKGKFWLITIISVEIGITLAQNKVLNNIFI